MNKPKQKPAKTKPDDRVAEIPSPHGNAVKAGSHTFYEMRRREMHPERYKNLIIVYGSEIPKRVKGRSKRGWTAPTK